MPSSDPTSRIDIEEWRSSLSLPTSHAVPTLGRYPLQPSTSSSQHSSLSNYPKKRTPPSLHLQQPLSNLSATASSGGDDTDASGSETESQKAIKSSKKEEADRLVGASRRNPSLLTRLYVAYRIICSHDSHFALVRLDPRTSSIRLAIPFSQLPSYWRTQRYRRRHRPTSNVCQRNPPTESIVVRDLASSEVVSRGSYIPSHLAS